MFMRELEETEEVPTDLMEPAEWEVPTEWDMFMRDLPDLPELEVPADFLEAALLEVPTERLSRDTESSEVPTDLMEPAELEVPTDMFMRDFLDFLDFLEMELDLDLMDFLDFLDFLDMDMFMRESPEWEVPLDWFPLLEVPTEWDMFMRDLPEDLDFLETLLAPEMESTDLSDFFPKRVSQKESFWRDLLDGVSTDLLELENRSTSSSSSRLRRMILTEDLPDLDLKDFFDFLEMDFLPLDMFMRELDLLDLEQEDLVPFLTHLPFFPLTHIFLTLSGERLTRLLDLPDLEQEDLVHFLTTLPYFPLTN